MLSVLPVATNYVADSIFHGFIDDSKIENKLDAEKFQKCLKRMHPGAAHVVICWIIKKSHYDNNNRHLHSEKQNDDDDIDENTNLISLYDNSSEYDIGFDEDGEPFHSTGPFIIDQLRHYYHHRTRATKNKHSCDESGNGNGDGNGNCFEEKQAVCLGIVRYVGSKLLGVTCGRLSQCYSSISKLTLHRYYNGQSCPLVEEYYFTVNTGNPSLRNNNGIDEDNIATAKTTTTTAEPIYKNNCKNIYGLGAGDCELILDFISENDFRDSDDDCDDKHQNSHDDNHRNNNGHSQKKKTFSSPTILSKIQKEVRFDGFLGSENEELPRLQNLQADIIYDECDNNNNNNNNNGTGTDGDEKNVKTIPIYRYPGNYSGVEWKTYNWSPTTYRMKQYVEKALEPLYTQPMNHCVTNYYRENNIDDFIGHHSDKVLDLDKETGIIVSVSLGDARILELKRRKGRKRKVTILAYNSQNDNYHHQQQQEKQHQLCAADADDDDEPQDIQRILLPPKSMLVLGKYTNEQFTHSILPASYEGLYRLENHVATSMKLLPRISLTFRNVVTFMDCQSGRLYGEGTAINNNNSHHHDKKSNEKIMSLNDLYTHLSVENTYFLFTYTTIVSCILSLLSHHNKNGIRSIAPPLSLHNLNHSNTTINNNVFPTFHNFQFIGGLLLSGSYVLSLYYFRKLRHQYYQKLEEKHARNFFSKHSVNKTKY